MSFLNKVGDFLSGSIQKVAKPVVKAVVKKHTSGENEKKALQKLNSQQVQSQIFTPFGKAFSKGVVVAAASVVTAGAAGAFAGAGVAGGSAIGGAAGGGLTLAEVGGAVGAVVSAIPAQGKPSSTGILDGPPSSAGIPQEVYDAIKKEDRNVTAQLPQMSFEYILIALVFLALLLGSKKSK